MSLKLLQLNFTPEPQTLNTSFWEVYTKFLKIKKNIQYSWFLIGYPQIWFFYIVPHCTFIIWADKTQESLFFNLALPCTHAYHFILSITLTLKPKYIQYSTTSFYFHCPGSRLNYWTEMTSLQFYFMIWKTCHVTIMFYQAPNWSLQSSSQFGSWLLLSQNYQMSHTS